MSPPNPNALDTIVALEESSPDGSFFQAKICFTFGRIFLYKRKSILKEEEEEEEEEEEYFIYPRLSHQAYL